MSMPFPAGTTFNFEVVSKNVNSPNNSLASEWGTMTFKTVDNQNQIVLAIAGGTDTDTEVVTWTSNSDNEGSIGATTFTIGTVEYSFQRITITNITDILQVAHVADADLTVRGATHHVFFTGLPTTSAFLNPKVGNYVDTSSPSLFTITFTPNGTISIAPAAGWTVSGTVWAPPSVAWPPTLQFTLQNTATSAQNVYTGVVTAQYNRGAQQVSYKFGGSVTSTGGAPGSVTDWTSTDETVPIPIPKATTHCA
jgi:hypothetical protein